MLGWFAYFEERPADWQSDLRASYILQAIGVKEKPEDIFPSLKRLKHPQQDGLNLEDIKSSSFFTKLKTAVGGDSIL